jgi:hypothetical protein
MGFFDQLPPVPEPEPEPSIPPRPAWMKPEAALGGVVAKELLLVKTAEAAVAIVGMLAYRTGFEFTLSSVLRREDRRGVFDPVMHHPFGRRADEPLPDRFLRLGVAFSDGTAVTNLDRRAFRWTESEPSGPLLMQDGGGGGGRRYDMTYWVWPLPPAGPLTFVCQWPAFGIPETRAEVDAALILEAATRAVQLWPEADTSGT